MFFDFVYGAETSEYVRERLRRESLVVSAIKAVRIRGVVELFIKVSSVGEWWCGWVIGCHWFALASLAAFE